MGVVQFTPQLPHHFGGQLVVSGIPQLPFNLAGGTPTNLDPGANNLDVQIAGDGRVKFTARNGHVQFFVHHVP